MRFCLGTLRWSPDAFWSATPREIAAALHAHGAGRAAAAPGRGSLERLMALYPDQTETDRNGHAG